MILVFYLIFSNRKPINQLFQNFFLSYFHKRMSIAFFCVQFFQKKIQKNWIQKIFFLNKKYFYWTSNGARFDCFINQIGPRCCTNRQKNVSPIDRLQPLLNERNHEILGKPPLRYYNEFTVRCKIHGMFHNISYYDYRKAQYGMFCCGNAFGATKRVIYGKSIGRVNPVWRISGQ